MFDAIVIGGSYAGLTGATQLARARRRILVIDSGKRRNRFASESHGFLSRDGASPAEIAAAGKAQLLAYPTVEWRDAEVASAQIIDGGFAVTDAEGHRAEGRRLLLALGVTDELPPVPGLAERWGSHVFHCPYCHGYEVEGAIGVLAVTPNSLHHAAMLPDWGSTIFFLNGGPMPGAEDLDLLTRRGVTIEPEPIREIAGAADIVLASGRVVSLGGLFTATATRPATPIAEHLGCAMDEGPAGSFIRTGMTKETTVPGVFACGDAARAFGSLALAVGDGSLAGSGVHQSLIFRAD